MKKYGVLFKALGKTFYPSRKMVSFCRRLQYIKHHKTDLYRSNKLPQHLIKLIILFQILNVDFPLFLRSKINFFNYLCSFWVSFLVFQWIFSVFCHPANLITVYSLTRVNHSIILFSIY